MKTIRVVPRLDIKGTNLVKGIHLEGLRVLGNPKDFARYYYEEGADELMYMDVVASLYGRNSILKIITETAKDISIPLLVGGGIRTIDDISNALKAGADRVSLNTAALAEPDIVKKAAQKFGSSTIVVCIEAIKQSDGSYLAYCDNGREYTGIEVGAWASRVEEMGAGEIIITSVDKEGTGKGFDIDLTKKVSERVSIPVIAHGGCGKALDAVQIVKECDIDAIAISSILHYEAINNSQIKKSRESIDGNTHFLDSGNKFGNIAIDRIRELKMCLMKNDISVRI